MAVLENKIGVYSFLAIAGEPPVPQEQIAIAQRPGVDGIELIKLGIKSRPVTLRCIRDCADPTDVQMLLEEFLLLKETPQELIHNGVSSHIHWYNISILDVVVAMQQPISKAIGGLLADPTVLASFDFTVIPVAIKID